MSNAEFVDLVAAMRAAQDRFYRGGRTSDQLREAKRLEKQVDAALAAIRDPQPTLFGD